MKRLFLGFAIGMGMVVMGAVNASASTYCSLDPTLDVGTPLKYKATVNANLGVVSVDVYAHGNHHSTTFGGGLGVL